MRLQQLQLLLTLAQTGSMRASAATMNVTQPPFDNIKVRQAILFAVDRDAFVKQADRQYGQGTQ
mgnify:CR=1 FL=1